MNDIQRSLRIINEGPERRWNVMLVGIESMSARFLAHYRDTFLATSTPYPGVVEGLQRMRDLGLRLACVTNKSESFTLPLLAPGLSALFFVLSMVFVYRSFYGMRIASA